MGVFDKYNTGYPRIDWGVKTDGYKFNKLGNLFERGIKDVDCVGFFFTKGEYGLQAVAIGKGELYNLPKSKTEVVQKMLADNDAVNAIKAGKLMLHIRSYINSLDKKCYDCDFVEKLGDDAPLF